VDRNHREDVDVPPRYVGWLEPIRSKDGRQQNRAAKLGVRGEGLRRIAVRDRVPVAEPRVVLVRNTREEIEKIEKTKRPVDRLVIEGVLLEGQSGESRSINSA
jgi:hypothetical protein